MATTISLAGRLADIMSRPIDSISNVTVKAPSYRPGPGVELTTSQPTNVQLGGDGEITIEAVEGVGWIYVEGDGWSDSIRFVAAEGMTTIWEAVINALPIVVEAKRLFYELGRLYEDSRGSFLDLASQYTSDLSDISSKRLEDLKKVFEQGRADIDSMGEDYVAVFNDLKQQVESYVYSQTDGEDATILGVLSNPSSQTNEWLESSLATKSEIDALDGRTSPQKMLLGLPVHKPHRNPNLAITKSWPDSTANIQIIFTEGETVWGTARDLSLYKSTSAGHWEHKAYLSSGVAPRGGMVRCADNSLLHFDTSYRMRRSTNEGSSWTIVHERRAPGLEPLTTQSIVVQPGTGHIYYGEYTNGTGPETVDCALWRSTDHGVTWEIIYTWGLLGRAEGPEIIRHIHSVQVDPYTEEVYVMLGDGTPATGIWKVQGDTCVPVLTNDMLGEGWLDSPRCIGMMFFPDWIAWGSDSTTNPYLFRIPRSAFGADPSKLERGPRLSSTAWGTARASEDGSRWALFTSDEAYPNYAADRMAHIYVVEDQGATIYEVGAIPARSTSGVTTLQPMAQPEKYGLEFAFNMRTGSSADYAAWRARIGYGGQTIPWPTQPRKLLTQSQSSGLVELEGGQTKVFGGTRVPVYAKTLAIYDSTVMQQTGTAGNLVLQIVVDGAVVWSSAQASSRTQGRREFGGPVAFIPLAANTNVVFQTSNLHAANPISGAASITFEWVE